MKRICRECYNDPLEVYETLKRRGMDLVTVTDHDRSMPWSRLRHLKDFFLSEEVTAPRSMVRNCIWASTGLRSATTVELQLRRDDLPRLVAYLCQRRAPFQHQPRLSSLTGPRTEADFDISPKTSQPWRPATARCSKQPIAMPPRCGAHRPHRDGSAATLTPSPSLGRTYTTVTGAQTAAEFLEGLNQGRSKATGESGDTWNSPRQSGRSARRW